ncbi:unnamed protein product [Musa acuminata subsp. burmannicoides]
MNSRIHQNISVPFTSHLRVIKVDEKITVRWALSKYNEGNEREILYRWLRAVVEAEVLKKISTLSFRCAAPTRRDRPVTREVVDQRWGIMSRAVISRIYKI